MISHKHKFIFIHIPKCAGTSLTNLFFKDYDLDWKKPNYEIHYGWCPKRKIHMQHATPLELLDLGLIDKDIWDSYYKFTVVRNPWSRAHSDYFWLMKTRKIKDSFQNYINKRGEFEEILRDRESFFYRGDHLTSQSSYLDTEKNSKIDKIIKFENISKGVKQVLEDLKLPNWGIPHTNKGKKQYKHYSDFYTNTNKKLVELKYKDDIKILKYKFEDKRKGVNWLKKFI
jgi:hypothetical protein